MELTDRSSPPQPQKRLPKVRQACDCCHARKIRCDAENPCSNCRSTELICTYLAVPKKKGPKGKRVHKDGVREGKRVKRLRVVQEFSRTHVAAPEIDDNGEGNQQPKAVNVPIVENHGFKSSPLISNEIIQSCVDAFFTHKYPIMPILDLDQVNATLPHIRQSPEKYALITSLCAGIVQQPEIIESPQVIIHPIQTIPKAELPTAEYFIQETIRARQFCNYTDAPSLETVHTSFFLFAALFCLGKDNSAYFYIREAMTVLQLLRLHEENTYSILSDNLYAIYSRRTFWLLFITERAYALQRHRPLTLHRTISLPGVDPGPESKILSGFLDLVSLFQNFDDEFLSLWNLSSPTSATPAGSASFRSLIQMQEILKFAIPNVSERTEVQQADLLISRQWLKTMVWQLCVTKGLLSSTSAIEPMSFEYPVTIARDVVLVSKMLSPKALEANGVGILEKIFDIGCSLADVLQLHTNYMQIKAMEVGPRDYLMEMFRLLSTGRGAMGVQNGASGSNGGEKFLRILAGKADECLNIRINRVVLSSKNSTCIEEVEDNEDGDNEDGDNEDGDNEDEDMATTQRMDTDWNDTTEYEATNYESANDLVYPTDTYASPNYAIAPPKWPAGQMIMHQDDIWSR